MKTWFCSGFTRRQKLSHTRVAGASRKLPNNWQDRVRQIIERVANSQQWRREGRNAVPPVLDDFFVNSDHLPFCRNMAGVCSWTKQGAGGRNKRDFRGQVGTGGGEKDRFAVQLTVAKDGTKLKPCVMFKGASFNGTREHRRRAVSHESLNRLDDDLGNSYPPAEKTHLTRNESGNSNGTLTKDILENATFPHIKVEEGNRGGALVDDFKGHSTDLAKEHVKSFKSDDDDDDDEDRCDLIDFYIMGGGITPKSQPLDLFLGKITKGYCRDLHDACMLNAPGDPVTGHPFMPSRQLCATWVVAAWERVPEDLVRKAWTVGNYKTFEESQQSPGEESFIYNQNNIVEIIAEVENSDDLIQHYLAADNVHTDSEFDDENVME